MKNCLTTKVKMHKGNCNSIAFFLLVSILNIDAFCLVNKPEDIFVWLCSIRPVKTILTIRFAQEKFKLQQHIALIGMA